MEKETVNFPRETTMQEISQALQTIAFLKSGEQTNITNWETLSGLVRNGYAEKIFDYGTQFIENWRDTAVQKDYEYPWQVNHFDNYELENGEIFKGMCIQAHYAHPFGVQFSQARAFLKCPEGLAAGTYNITFGKDWGTYGKENATWQFTLTQAVPKGGKLAGFTRLPDTAPSTWKVTSYKADGIEKIETVAVSSGNAGTALGTMKLNTRNGNLNSMQETAYGWNRWKTSALRQYLNSDKEKGKWWTAQDEWDVAPDQLATKDGFLRGMPEKMLKVLKTVKVVTYTNTVQDGGETDITYDKIFIPSLEEMYINPEKTGEGNVHEYWKRRSGSKTKLQQWQTYLRMISYSVSDHTSPQTLRLRSANRAYACNTWFVYSSGGVYGSYGWYAYTFSPLAVL